MSPYRGLAGFEERHADWFFGRERLRVVAVDRILSVGADVPQLLVGASGSGKSSLLRAGVLPVLRGEHRFLPLQLTPGRDPMGALTSALSAQWNAVHRAQWADEADDAVELAAHVKTLAQRERTRRPGGRPAPPHDSPAEGPDRRGRAQRGRDLRRGRRPCRQGRSRPGRRVRRRTPRDLRGSGPGALPCCRTRCCLPGDAGAAPP
ncbi:hypothetical protein ABZ667_26750 [Streptomyces lavendulae]|uniref:nSTAND1 domain-containing NTPase n=1 Tax=Streptomyces lavendulae TaxID=1914 RepID=UPI0033C37E9F